MRDKKIERVAPLIPSLHLIPSPHLISSPHYARHDPILSFQVLFGVQGQ